MIALGIAISLCTIIYAALTAHWWLLAVGFATLGALLWQAVRNAPSVPPDDPEGRA